MSWEKQQQKKIIIIKNGNTDVNNLTTNDDQMYRNNRCDLLLAVHSYMYRIYISNLLFDNRDYTI